MISPPIQNPKSKIQNRLVLAPEHPFIVNLVREGSRVLDLGCGEGDLMLALQELKAAKVEGIDLNDEYIAACVAKGLFNVRHGNLDEGLADYEDGSMDTVILTNVIQALHRPSDLIREVVRVGKQCIISFPNFAHWTIRIQLLMNGRMPKNPQLPYEWHDSPNIHLTTLADFRDFCRSNHILIRREIPLLTGNGRPARPVSLWPNLLADTGIFLVEGSGFSDH